MAGNHPDLQAHLRALDEEYQEGEITQKGYEKRRTFLFSQMPPVPIQRSAEQGSYTGNDFPISPTQSESFVNSSTLNRQSVVSDELPANLRDSQDFSDDRFNAANFQENELGFPLPSQVGSLDPSFLGTPQAPTGYESSSHTGTMLSQNFAFNPNNKPDEYSEHEGFDLPTFQPTIAEAQDAYFSDFAGQQSDPRDGYDFPDGYDLHDGYGGGLRYSQMDTFALPVPPSIHAPMIQHLLPLEPREVPFDVCDPHNHNLPMSKFENLPSVLRHRAKAHPKQLAYWVLDQRGKEVASITWEKLGSRAEKVAQVIRDKSSLYRGDRVALVYRDTEVIEFVVALLGCFIAGVVAVPINKLEDYANLKVILTSSQAHLALTTENNLKNFHRDITMQRLTWPRGVEWWKTNEFGSYHPRKKEEVPPLAVPDLAYIEFSRSPTGDLRGVVLSHRTIMHQMNTLAAVVASVPTDLTSNNNQGDTMISYLDPRQSIGLILGVLFTVYSGTTVVWMEARAVEMPGLYASLITKYRASLIAADYPGLKLAAYNYQQDPMTTRNFKKNAEPNFSAVKYCFIDTLTVDSEFHEILADRWFRPLRNTRARDVVSPMLCLPEHGGMVISLRDWLGGAERLGCPLIHRMDPSLREEPDYNSKSEEKTEDKYKNKGTFGSSLIGGGSAATPKKSKEGTRKTKEDIWEVLLDKEALKSNEVVVLAMGEDARKAIEQQTMPNSVRVGAFGYPVPDATLAIVDPETGLLCTPNIIGEVWVDSPSLSGGFWALPKHTEMIFHARPYRFLEGSPTPSIVETEFLRTGLLGCIIEGKLYVLGLYEDRLRQKVIGSENSITGPEHRYFFVQHLILSIMKNIPKIYDCSAFDVFVNEEHLPVVVLESFSASTAPLTSGGPPRQLDVALLDSLAERCMEILFQEHRLRVYCVVITAPNTLPRVTKNGRLEIGNLLCRKEFDMGALPCVHVRFGVEMSVMNIPTGIDPEGGIWSPLAATTRQSTLNVLEKQYTGIDIRDTVNDERTSTPLNNFTNIVDLLQWRVTRQGEELALCSVDGRGKEGKHILWRKFDTKVAAVAIYLKNKAKLKAGDHVILMYTHSEDFVYAVHACLVLGLIAIPMAPVDHSRLAEDAPALLHLISDFRVKALLVNADVKDLLNQKVVSQHIKQSAHVLRIGVPSTWNTSKSPKQSHGCKYLGLTFKQEWLRPEHPAFVWTYWTPDQRRISVHIGHDTVMGMCKVQKETCQMTSTRPVFGSVRSTLGIGFLHTCLMGCYLGTSTYLISPLDFRANPICLFFSLSRYRIKDTYATTQMLDWATARTSGKGYQLGELKNMMITYESRPRPDLYRKVRMHFAATGLGPNAINSIYSHNLNPMISSRSYMCIEPVDLWLDPKALRLGYIYPVDPDVEPNSLLLQDSGIVPVCTQIAIVNPETRCLCHVGEYGEIWVQSEACAKAFYGSTQEFDLLRFKGRILDGDPNTMYVRTGDLGFLHSVRRRPIGPGGQPVDMQLLYVLGGIGETFEIDGLNHFPMDIENTIERCHRNIVPGGSAVFQAGGLTVIVAEVTRKSYLASIVPVILNAVLNEHQIIADIISFIPFEEFPRSRLGEKQRGKILASWVSKKMRTMAQFTIRDEDGPAVRIMQLPPDPPRTTSLVSQLQAQPIQPTLYDLQPSTSFHTFSSHEFDSNNVYVPPSDPAIMLGHRPSLEDFPNNNNFSQQDAYLSSPTEQNAAYDDSPIAGDEGRASYEQQNPYGFTRYEEDGLELESDKPRRLAIANPSESSDEAELSGDDYFEQPRRLGVTNPSE